MTDATELRRAQMAKRTVAELREIAELPGIVPLDRQLATMAQDELDRRSQADGSDSTSRTSKPDPDPA